MYLVKRTCCSNDMGETSLAEGVPPAVKHGCPQSVNPTVVHVQHRPACMYAGLRM